MSPIYTRSGDAGETSLVDGTRVRKDSLRVTAYGAVDELNAVIGLAVTELVSADPRSDALVERLRAIQRDLFVIGATLATPTSGGAGARSAGSLPQLDENTVVTLEREIDELTAQLPRLQHFILPGGGRAGAALHLARTVCRRAEREVVALFAEERGVPLLLRYLNRLSDYLFMAARWANHVAGAREERWPGDGQSLGG